MSPATIDESRVIECFAKNTVEVPAELQILNDDEPTPEDPACFIVRIMTPKDGDKRIVWNRRSIPEINAAKNMMQDLIAKGMVPFKIDPSTGEKTAMIMDEFDAFAGELMMSDQPPPQKPRQAIVNPVKAVAGG